MNGYLPAWAHRELRRELAGIICATLAVMILTGAAVILWTAPRGTL